MSQDTSKVVIDFIDSTLELVSERDKYTAEHCIGVGRLAAELAKSLGLDEVYVNELQLAGRAHDIGKLAWPDKCFTESCKEELGADFDRMFYHPTRGRKFLYNSLESLYPSNEPNSKCELRWTEWVWLHHWGYKDNYRMNPPLVDQEVKDLLACINNCQFRKEIELGIGIMHVADSFHAAISGRLYRKVHPKSKSVKQAIDELVYESGEQYHPDVVSKIKGMESWLKQVFIPDIYSQ